MKATMMLKAGEEEFWANQHPQPYIFPDSPGGTYLLRERYECYTVRQGFITSYRYVCNNMHSNVGLGWVFLLFTLLFFIVVSLS